MRIPPLEEKQASWILKPIFSVMKRRMGKVLNPYKAWSYRPGPAFTVALFQQSIESSKVIDATLKRLVCLRAAQIIGCVF